MNNKSILITGASDGLGKALALELASRGYALALTARRFEKLEAIQQDLQNRHPGLQVEIAAMDVSRTDTLYDTILDLKTRLKKLDIVFANAGIAYAGKIGKSPLDNHLQVIQTNVNGAIATLDAGVRIFREQGFGHLVGTSSVAAYRGFPRNAAYCASKAALSTFMEALRAETYKEDISVTVLHPGYIDTDINRALDSRPFLIDAKKGAVMMANMIEKKVARSTVPVYPWALLAPLLRRLPTSMIAKM
ncbi:MAG: short chain dehydrogenase [Oleiphilus sp.]|nr:MAG: short chain dehydrogenase [Oleiphilus sp.]